MRIFLICIALLFTYSCKAQKNQNLQSDILSFFKINDKDIQNCKKEGNEFRKNKFDETTIKTIQDACTARLEYLNFFRSNTLKMLEKTSDENDFLIINYISDNVPIPYSTKTILKIDSNYYGLKHYFEDQNGQFIDKNEEFEVSKYEKETIGKIDEYLKTGKSEYVSNKSNGKIGLHTHWNVVTKNNGKVKMIELYRIK
ncbi:hypothetical protein SAMN05421594_2812 [Chryseobacterium oleae]|uniref:Uncharacterized protein n=1 Tax=Chryseobacterium oleae TaxID=491207 RepID=A0A1I4Z0X7_CHROL|nr:hypothetical protein [Chryseobacterium oleae]SFN43703.1 hypothetical protein SAMN05421594_2812 [Chryseobacterium oleae]